MHNLKPTYSQKRKVESGDGEADSLSTGFTAPLKQNTKYILAAAVAAILAPGYSSAQEVVSVSDWYNPNWGGGFNATFRCNVTEADTVNGPVGDWFVDLNYDGPGSITRGWTTQYNGTVTTGFIADDGGFAVTNHGAGFQPPLNAGDSFNIAVLAEDAGFNESDFNVQCIYGPGQTSVEEAPEAVPTVVSETDPANELDPAVPIDRPLVTIDRPVVLTVDGVEVNPDLLMGSTLTSDPTAVPGTTFSCGSQAYLTQGQQPSTYSLNLLSGDYTVAALEHSERVNNQPGNALGDALNALGFNMRDQYVYGWSFAHGEPARIHNDWSVEPLDGVNITRHNFDVGDVSTDGSKYYVYRSGGNAGLYSIGLDPDADDYLQMERIINGGRLRLEIADFAFNPLDSLIYAMDSDGILHQIDPDTGDSRELGDTGAGSGSAYGAAFFDGDGAFYASRNNDGAVFRIDIPGGIYTAQLFSMGPSTTSNDGFRCAEAPLIDVDDDSIDFGDAPESYGTYLSDNGARHGLLESPEVRLGASADGESEAYAFPLSDNDGTSSDEDGVQFVTNMVANRQAITMVHANAAGYLNVWVDTDQNGSFDAGEQLVTDRLLNEGRQPVYLAIPDNAVAGDTWARFRFSSYQGLQTLSLIHI